MRIITASLIVAVVVLGAIYDIIAAVVGGQESTISVIVWNVSLKHPVIPFAVGVLCGHLFWRLSE
jgi:hypothetical protein